MRIKDIRRLRELEYLGFEELESDYGYYYWEKRINGVVIRVGDKYGDMKGTVSFLRYISPEKWGLLKDYVPLEAYLTISKMNQMGLLEDEED